MNQRRGLSLVELLIAVGLFAILASLLSGVFASSMRSYSGTSERVHLMQLATIAVEKIRADLGQTTVEGVTILNPTTDRQLIVLQKLVNITSSGTPALADQLIIYEWAGQQLRQSEYDPTVPGTISATYQSPTLPEVETYLTTARTRVLAGQVIHFQLEDANPALPTIELPLRLVIRLEQKVTRGLTPRTVELQRRIFLRNR